MTRYRTAAFLTSLALTFSMLGVSPAPRPSCRPLTDLYSQRALRRMRNLFQMRMYEWKVQQLERAKAAAQHRISVNQLLDSDVASPSSITEGRETSKLKQKPALGATTCL